MAEFIQRQQQSGEQRLLFIVVVTSHRILATKRGFSRASGPLTEPKTEGVRAKDWAAVLGGGV